MRAVLNPMPGQLILTARPDPVAETGQVIVAVRAAGLNRADLSQRAGNYPAPPGWPADIMGMEFAGEVASTGDGVADWRLGDRVMGLVGGGAQAEFIAVNHDQLLPIPPQMTFADAAAIPEAFLTAWDALIARGRASSGDRVLVHAIGSGVGTAAAQLGRALGLTIIGTSRTQDKLARCRALGMTHGVLTTEPDWPTAVGAVVQVIVDTLGAGALDQNLALLAPRGRLVVLGTMTGGKAAGIDLGLVLRRRLEIIGTAMRPRSAAERAALIAGFNAQVMPWFNDGTLAPIVDRVLSFDKVDSAYALLASNATFGKVILQW